MWNSLRRKKIRKHELYCLFFCSWFCLDFFTKLRDADFPKIMYFEGVDTCYFLVSFIPYPTFEGYLCYTSNFVFLFFFFLKKKTSVVLCICLIFLLQRNLNSHCGRHAQIYAERFSSCLDKFDPLPIQRLLQFLLFII